MTPRVQNVLLVHGAYADGSSYARVIPLLEAKGLHVVAVQNPLTSLADDVAATKRAIARHDGPVILIGHSSAGVVIVGNDRMVPPEHERFAAKRMHATVTTLSAGHVPMLSRPKAVAAVILDAAEKAATAVARVGERTGISRR